MIPLFYPLAPSKSIARADELFGLIIKTGFEYPDMIVWYTITEYK